MNAESIIEPFSVPDVFCTNLLRVERVGPCARLVFGVRVLVDDGAGRAGPELHVVARIVVPADLLVTIGTELVQRPDLKPEAQVHRMSEDVSRH